MATLVDQLRAKADTTIDTALADFDDQLTKGWTLDEAATVLGDTLTHASAILRQAAMAALPTDELVA